MTGRLSIAELQIWLNERGEAMFSDTRHRRDRATVERVLAEYRDDIDEWLEVSEQARPRHVWQDEREFRQTLQKFGRSMAKLRDTEVVKEMVRLVAPTVAASWPSLSPGQVSESVEAVISML